MACIPIKIIRHTSPLEFLQTVDKYTMTFVDGVGQKKTFAHKTLSEIVQCLKDSGYVLGDGADKALNALLWGYAERNIIEDNVEMNYVGFFTDKENNIIASNIDILEPNWDKISDALNFIIELKPYYENRLDLLATSIVWGMIAPVMFMLKQNNHFLKLLHFYGSANATKSNTGKVILALDGHQEDRKYSLNLSRFDSIARVGEALGHTTFPILVDEMDLMNPKHHWLIEVLKSIVESQISRSKFPSSRASGTIDIPALCLPILTGNPPPPLNESAYMKRVIARYFPQSETMKESDPQSSKFREFVRINLARLKALGDFGNWYIMNNQKEFLDERSPPPLDLGLKILKTAFEYSGIEIPHWLEKERLAEDQLEQSLEDNDYLAKSFEVFFFYSQLVAKKFYDKTLDKKVPAKEIE